MITKKIILEGTIPFTVWNLMSKTSMIDLTDSLTLNQCTSLTLVPSFDWFELACGISISSTSNPLAQVQMCGKIWMRWDCSSREHAGTCIHILIYGTCSRYTAENQNKWTLWLFLYCNSGDDMSCLPGIYPVFIYLNYLVKLSSLHGNLSFIICFFFFQWNTTYIVENP